jgi:hypothetical protein
MAAGLGYLFFGDPGVTFRSSDGKWADSEIKSRTFSYLILEEFEGYKRTCAPNATLFRATSKDWWNVFAWYSYATDPKWRVPYSDAHAEIGDYYPPATSNACTGPSSFHDLDIDERLAKDHLEQLEVSPANFSPFSSI